MKVLYTACVFGSTDILRLTEISTAWLRHRSNIYDIWLGVNDLKSVPEAYFKSFDELGVNLFEFAPTMSSDNWLTSMHARYSCASKFIDMFDVPFCLLEQDVFLLNPIGGSYFNATRPLFPRHYQLDYVGDFMVFVSDSKYSRTSMKLVNACMNERLLSPEFIGNIISHRMDEDPTRIVSTEEVLETISSCCNGLIDFYNFNDWSIPNTLPTASSAVAAMHNWQAIHMSRWSLRITNEEVVDTLMNMLYAGVSQVIKITKTDFNELLLGRDSTVYFNN